jgi:hypothetical protein
VLPKPTSVAPNCNTLPAPVGKRRHLEPVTVSDLCARAACRELVKGTATGAARMKFLGSLAARILGQRCGSDGGGGAGEVSGRSLHAHAVSRALNMPRVRWVFVRRNKI